MKFISIDSSLAHTGVAIGNIVDGKIDVTKILLHSTEKTDNKQVRASSDTITRCRSTVQFISQILIDEDPVVIFVETPSGSQSANGMKSYGATCQLIAMLSPDPVEVTPMETKLASVGSKTASKRDIINWAYNIYPALKDQWVYHGCTLQAKNEHMADAIAIAHAGIRTTEFRKLIKILGHE